MPHSLPTLYYYEHCPYCIRVLAFCGLANISTNRTILLNDDDETPVKMIGEKMLPILEKTDGTAMGESLDILEYLAKTYDYPLLRSEAIEQQVSTLLSDIRSPLHGLTIPRWVKIPFKEFQTESSRRYFANKKTEIIGNFSEALAKTNIFSAALNQSLSQYKVLFDELGETPKHMATIILFSHLYGLTCVKDLSLPVYVEDFMQTMSQKTQLPLFTSQAV
ncbi:MAG: glutaredoxin 2 [Ostreibacterium sp.]